MTDPNISDEPPFVRELLQLLRDAGFNISETRFPFTYHHDAIRPIGVSRSETAATLHRDFREKFGLQVYYAEACLGAVSCLIAQQPGVFLRAVLKEGQERLLTDALRNLRFLIPDGKSKFV